MKNISVQWSDHFRDFFFIIGRDHPSLTKKDDMLVFQTALYPLLECAELLNPTFSKLMTSNPEAFNLTVEIPPINNDGANIYLSATKELFVSAHLYLSAGSKYKVQLSILDLYNNLRLIENLCEKIIKQNNAHKDFWEKF